MKRLVLVTVVALLLSLPVLGEMTESEKIAYLESVEQAKNVFENNLPMTNDQRELLHRIGYGQSPRELDDTGGPDEFGYFFIDSREETGPTYEWVEIRPEEGGEGTALNLTDDGYSTFLPMPAGWSFSFYGEFYETFNISSNGWVSFISASGGLSGTIPNTTTPNATLAVYWRDLDPGDTAEEDVWYYFDMANERIIVQYHTGNFPGPNNNIKDFQIIIDVTDNSVIYQYNTSASGWGGDTGVTIGIEDHTGTLGLTYPHTSIEDELAIRWYIGEGESSVTGILHDFDTHMPVEGALVRMGFYQAISDADGVFTFEDIFSGAYTMRITKVGYATFTQDVVLTEGLNEFAYDIHQAAPSGPFADFEASDGGWTVVGGEWEWGAPTGGPGNAHSGSNVWATNLTGNYINSANAYLISPAFTPSQDNHVFSFWTWWNYETGWDGFNVQVSTNGGSTWSVITPEGGYNNPDVVGLDDQPGFSSNSNGWLEKSVNLSNFVGQDVMIRFRHGSDTIINGYWGAAIDDVTIPTDAAAHGAISGLVTYAVGGLPVPEATIVLYPAGSQEMIAEATTRVQGFFRFPYLPVGSYRLAVTKPGFELAIFDDLEVLEDEETVQNVALGASTQQVIFSGTVVSSVSPETPVVGAVVSVPSLSAEAVTDEDGFFTFGSRSEGLYAVNISHDPVGSQGYHDIRYRGVVLTEETVPLELIMYDILPPENLSATAGDGFASLGWSAPVNLLSMGELENRLAGLRHTVESVHASGNAADRAKLAPYEAELTVLENELARRSMLAEANELDELSDFQGYRVRVDNTVLPTLIQSPFYTVTGLTNGHLYSFAVAADYGYDEEYLVWSEPVSTRPLPNPGYVVSVSPQYMWEEINPANGGEGTPLNLFDDSYSGFIDMEGMSFSHYGVVYTEFNISSNGWISFTSATGSLTTTLPSTALPNATICLFGRDLDPGDSAEEDVFYLIDPDNDRIIVQYYTGNFNGPHNNTKSFELILDCASNIAYFSYESVATTWEVGVAIGMEDAAGVEAATFPSASLEEEMTLVWTQVSNFGNAVGTIVDIDTDQPLEGARVLIEGHGGYVAFSDEDGYYELLLLDRDWAPVTLIFQADGYEELRVEGVTWEEEEFEVVVDVELTHVGPESPPVIDSWAGNFDDRVRLFLRIPGSFEGMDIVARDDGMIADAWALPGDAHGAWATPFAISSSQLLQVEAWTADSDSRWMPRGLEVPEQVRVVIRADDEGLPGDVLWSSEPMPRGRLVVNPAIAVDGTVWVTVEDGVILVDAKRSEGHPLLFSMGGDTWYRFDTPGDPMIRLTLRNDVRDRVDVASEVVGTNLPAIETMKGAPEPTNAWMRAAVYGSLTPEQASLAPLENGLTPVVNELDEITFNGYIIYGSTNGTDFVQLHEGLIEVHTFDAVYGSEFEDQPIYFYARANVTDSDQGEVISLPSDTVVAVFNMRPSAPTDLDGDLVVEGNNHGAELTWAAVTTNADGSVCVDVDEYRVYRGAQMVGTVNHPTTTFTDFPPDYGFYTYSVVAVDEVPNLSNASVGFNMYVGPTGFFSNFEGDISDFVQDDRWQIGEPINPPGTFSPVNVLATNLTGQYANNDNNFFYWDAEWAVRGEGQLVYMHYLNYETGWDGYQVQVSVDEGETWEIITPAGGYPHQSIVGLNNTPGFTQAPNIWQQVVFELGQYEGQLIKFRFRHGTDGSVLYYGVAIDDIYLMGGVGYPDFGSISGRILACDESGEGVPGVEIRLGDSDRLRAVTQFDGSFMVDSVLVDTWNVHFHHNFYWPISVNNVTVSLDEDTPLGDLVMLKPEGSVSQTTIEMYVPIGPGQDSTATATLELTSDGCGVLDWSAWLAMDSPGSITAQIRPRGGATGWSGSAGAQVAKADDQTRGPRATLELDDLWDNLLTFNSSTSSGANTPIAAATTATQILMVNADDATLQRFSHTGAYIGSTPFPNSLIGGDNNPPADLAVDPVIGGLYGGTSEGNLYYFSEQLTGVILLGNVGIPVKGLAFDFIENQLYVYGVNEFRRYDILSGDTEILFPNAGLGTVRGLAYMASDPDGYTIWIMSETTAGARISRFNPTTGFYDTQGAVLYPAGQGQAGGIEITNHYRSTMYDITTVLNRPSPQNDQVDIWEGLSTVPPWMRIDGVNAGMLEPGEAITLTLVADLRGTRIPVEPGQQLDVVLYFDGPYWQAPPAVYIPVTLTLDAPEAGDAMPTKYALHQNYPNPFNPTTRIKFDLVQAQQVKLAVYNIMGQEVARLVDNRMQPGFHAIEFDASRFASGVYFYRIETAAFTSMKKMVLVK